MTIRTILMTLFTLAMLMSRQCYAQPIPQTLYLPKNSDELEKYLRESLLRITYEVESRQTGQRWFERGTAFLISPGGYAVTARHVLEPAMDFENYDVLSLKVEYADGARLERAKLAGEEVLLSKTSDIATFRVSTPSGASFKHFLCVERGDISQAKMALLATLQFFNQAQQPDWQFFKKEITIDQRHGPDGLFDYWALPIEFENSMSGGAVLLNGRVAAVVSNSLMDGGKPVPGGNYANLLRYADDTAWRGRADECTPGIDNPQQFITFKSQQAFMSSTCEGTFAWEPGTGPGQFWSFLTSGNYQIRRQDLICDPTVCKRCAPSLKSIHIIINHSTAGSKSRECPVIRGTYYGVQVVPIFADDTRDTQTPGSWLFRSKRLLRRTLDGSFSGVTSGPREFFTLMPPSTYNNVTLQSARDPDYSPPRCTRVSKYECEDLIGLDYFDSHMRRGLQWHGFTKRGPNPMSTLGDKPTRETWVIPQNWIAEALQVKNWILTYDATTKSNSNKPVDFSFCIAGCRIRVS